MKTKFRTADGYTFNRLVEGGRVIWTDGDMDFEADAAGWPIDANGERLKGDYVD